jgi:hypothetical protein
MGCIRGISKELIGILKIPKVIWVGVKDPAFAGYMQREYIIYML